MRDAPKPITALQHILTDVKDKERPDEKQDVICKIICFDCQGIYIEVTGRNLNIRLQSCNKPQRHNTRQTTHTNITNERDTIFTRIRQHALHTTLITNKDLL